MYYHDDGNNKKYKNLKNMRDIKPHFKAQLFLFSILHTLNNYKRDEMTRLNQMAVKRFH